MSMGGGSVAGRVLFSGRVGVSYGQVYLACDGADVDLETSFAGQVNGLCGAASPGRLFLITGVNHGVVEMTVELHEAEPTLSADWEEAVEVSFANACSHPALEEWGGDGSHPLALPTGDYRVRYCARGMDAARDAETNYDEPIDVYLLQFWPGAAEPDRIVRQTSGCAAAWHRANGRAEAETSGLTAEQEEWLAGIFGGRVPNRRLSAAALAGYRGLDDLDLDLTFALSEADDSVHRAVAAWAALRALEVARLTDLPELAPSVAALRRGERAVAPFDGTGSWGRALTSPRSQTPVPPLFPPPVVRTRKGDVPEDHTQMREDAAIFALVATGEADSLIAALTSVLTAAITFGGDEYAQFLADLRRAFPQL